MADKWRGSARQRGYTWVWDQTAQRHKRYEPLCRMCRNQGITKQADVVDHIIPHKGDPKLMWDPTNLQSLCYNCHNSAKQSEERLGYSNQIGRDGWPIDPKHPLNRIGQPGQN